MLPARSRLVIQKITLKSGLVPGKELSHTCGFTV
jgi:hypothetical protein